MSKYHKKNQKTILEVVVLGIARALWWLITLPFSGLKKSAGITKQDEKHIREKRRQIENMLKSDNEIALKQTVFEADKLVDFLLKAKGYEGETFADRLRSAEKYTNEKVYQDVWRGHKTRNKLAHDNDHIDKKVLAQSIKMLINYTRQ